MSTRGLLHSCFIITICQYSTGILGQRNLALGLISSTEVSQQITALLANVHMPRTKTSRRKKKVAAMVGAIVLKVLTEEELSTACDKVTFTAAAAATQTVQCSHTKDTQPDKR